jgi:hypothetical protein
MGRGIRWVSGGQGCGLVPRTQAPQAQLLEKIPAIIDGYAHHQGS